MGYFGFFNFRRTGKIVAGYDLTYEGKIEKAKIFPAAVRLKFGLRSGGVYDLQAFFEPLKSGQIESRVIRRGEWFCRSDESRGRFNGTLEPEGQDGGLLIEGEWFEGDFCYEFSFQLAPFED